MPFRGRPIASSPISAEQRDINSLSRINDLRNDLEEEEDSHARIDIKRQMLEVDHDYMLRNGLIEERQPISSRLGQAVVNWAKNIPGRIVHPG